MNDKRILQTPGEKLVAARVSSGRNLDDLSEATKIPLPMLMAIEQDEYHKISGDLYVKSFLRSYATELAVEEEEILNLYRNFTGDGAGIPAGDGPAVWQEDEVQIKRLGPPWRTIGLVVVAVVVAAAAGYYFLSGGWSDSGTSPVQESGDIESPGAHEGPATGAPDTLSSQDQHESLLKAGPLENQSPGQAPEGAEVTESDSSPEPDQFLAALPGTPGALQIDGRTWPVVLRLICPQSRVISLKKDGDRQYLEVEWPTVGRPLPDGGVQAGRAYHTREGLVVYWGAEDHFSLRVDDPAGLRAQINNQTRDISGLGPGQEIILNDPDVIQSNLPSARSAD